MERKVKYSYDFKLRCVNEVLETNQMRLSITGWLRKDLIDVIVS